MTLLPLALAAALAAAPLAPSTPSAASPAATAAPAAAPDRAADAVRAHLEFLASDLLEGRASGSRGHEIAAAYVASQFRQLGLEPAGADGSYFLQVPMRRSETVEGSLSARLLGPGATGAAGRALSASEIALRPSLRHEQRSVEARLVFVGHGLSDPQLGIDDYRGLDVSGAIVVMLDELPRGLDPDIAAHLDDARRATAAAHGAIGMISLPGSDGEAAFKRAARPLTSWRDSAGRLGSGGELEWRVTVAPGLAAALFDGAAMPLAAVRRDVAAGRRPAGFALAPRLALASTSRFSDFTSPEVVARLAGKGPNAHEHVAVMGHLDHLGLRKEAKPGEDAIYNGALDNAAGVATLLDAARRFAEAPARPGRSILFVVHTGEEIDLLGAQYFMLQPASAARAIVAGVDLDMPVPLYPFTDIVAFGAGHSNVAQSVAAAAQTMGLTVAPDPMPEEGLFTRSDHYRFVQQGIPAILLFTGFGNGGKAEFERFFKQHYHKVSDDLSLAIRWDQLARYADLNHRIALELANAAERPRWYEGNYFGNLFAPGAPRARRLRPGH